MEELNKIISGLYAKIDNQEKIIRELQEELQKADSITQSCLFEGMEESTMNFRECLKALENYKQRIDKAIEILKLCNSQCSKEVIEILKGDSE